MTDTPLYARPTSRWSAINAEARRVLYSHHHDSIANHYAAALCDPAHAEAGRTAIQFVPERPQIRMRYIKEFDIALEPGEVYRVELKPSPQGDGAGE